MAAVETMNFDDARAKLSRMRATKEELTNCLNRLSGAVSDVVGSKWIAPGANQFQAAYDSWRNSLTQQINELDSLASSFEAEINELETAFGSMQGSGA